MPDLYQPEITRADLRTNAMFTLAMEPIGGKGTRKGTLRDLIHVLIFRLGVVFEASEVLDGKWVVKAKKRNARTLLLTTRPVTSEEDAELEFLYDFVRNITAMDRARYFNIKKQLSGLPG